MQMEIARARQFYCDGAELCRWLAPDGRRTFGMMHAVYRRLLERIARRPAAVLRGRVRLGRWEKLWLAARWLLLPPSLLSLWERGRGCGGSKVKPRSYS